jgi:hypothetical protein
MNPNNYATLEACQRLVDAGILLEKTDYVWIYARHIPLKGADRTWQLFDRRSLMAIEVTEQRPDCMIPAPSMAEVWRELPEKMKLFRKKKALHFEKWKGESYASYENGLLCKNINPTDSLIDLLIWVKAQKEGV